MSVMLGRRVFRRGAWRVRRAQTRLSCGRRDVCEVRRPALGCQRLQLPLLPGQDAGPCPRCPAEMSECDTQRVPAAVGRAKVNSDARHVGGCARWSQSVDAPVFRLGRSVGRCSAGLQLPPRRRPARRARWRRRRSCRHVVRVFPLVFRASSASVRRPGVRRRCGLSASAAGRGERRQINKKLV